MAATREKRATAGNKLAKLLDEEEEDDFYKTTYGGFEEEEHDEEFQFKEDEDVEDIVDSDFDIEENDELVSDQEEEGERKIIRKRGVITKAYKEPVKATKSKVKLERKPKPKLDADTLLDLALHERKSVRKATATKSAETVKRLQKRKVEEARRKSSQPIRREEYMPTQEELLEEAKITEEENLKSLAKYQQLELEKKKVRMVKKDRVGPHVRYVSSTMPLVEEIEPGVFEETGEKCCRTFVSFSDKETFDELFGKPKAASSRRHICPITRLPAKYWDPVTCLPYATIPAFRILREAYYTQLEAKGDMEETDVRQWVEWRKKLRQAKLAAKAKSKTLSPASSPAQGSLTRPRANASIINGVGSDSNARTQIINARALQAILAARGASQPSWNSGQPIRIVKNQ
ncbi:vacuolar protein sorting-associated protein 72 homolog isoform X2 [Artemia franciscana]|uniref:vacuolar protein sorting-associated protein 72 homolog isoform X2 n=1 Tax=Artemia franciscana TaxID=6661 RepID=UPI0032DAC0CC